MTQLVQGKDLIGIVPIDVYPFACHDLLEPYGEEMKTFMNLGDLENDRSFMEKVLWFPVLPLKISKFAFVKISQ